MNLKEEAIKYSKMGLSVIPLKPKSKLPQSFSWEAYQTRKAEPKKVAQWWDKWPDSNIGIITGPVSGLVVVDCDSREAMKLVLSYVRQSVLDRIPFSSTGNGFHLYFRYPKLPEDVALGNRGNLFKDKKRNVDVRGEGGYVVAPPSIHENGRRYAWASLNELIDRPEIPPELLVRIMTKGEGEEIRKPSKKAKVEILFEQTFESRTVDRKTGERGRNHEVKLRSSGHWSCTCDAFAKGHNDCWAMKAAKEKYDANRVH